MKACTKCGVEKPLDDFTKSKIGKMGRTSRCRVCTSQDVRDKRLRDPQFFLDKHARHEKRHKETINARRRARYAGKQVLIEPRKELSNEERQQRRTASRKKTYEKNKNKVLAVSAIYRLNNVQKLKAIRKSHYERNKKHVAKVTAAYRVANAHLYTLAAARRRGRKIQAQPVWADDAAMAEMYRIAQWMTQNSGEQWHVDHIVPLAGKTVCGLHWEANLTILPASDNLSKGNRYWPDMW